MMRTFGIAACFVFLCLGGGLDAQVTKVYYGTPVARVNSVIGGEYSAVQDLCHVTMEWEFDTGSSTGPVQITVQWDNGSQTTSNYTIPANSTKHKVTIVTSKEVPAPIPNSMTCNMTLRINNQTVGHVTSVPFTKSGSGGGGPPLP